MTTTLTAQLDRIVAGDKAQAWVDYRAIIARANAPKDGDAVRMSEITKLLSISQAEVESDASAVAGIPALVEKAAEADKLQEQIRPLMRSYSEKELILKEATRKLKGEMQEIRSKLTQLQYRQGQVRAAGERIPVVQQRAWRATNAPKPRPEGVQTRNPTGSGISIRFPAELWDEHLADHPPLVSFTTNKPDKASAAALQSHGYAPAPGMVDVWSLNGVTPDEPKPKAKAKAKVKA